jgi:predicted metal-dependent HD superfamily phosphohydrolase
MATSDSAIAEIGWNEVMAKWGIQASEARSAAFHRLVAAYSEPHRCYHNLHHILQVLGVLRLFEPKVKDWPSVFLAAFYHDYVYDPQRSDNEQRSAEALAATMSEFGVFKVQRACDLILFTKNHSAPDQDTDAHLLIGADLSIFARPTAQYEAYRVQIRGEYSWVPEMAFCQGRRAVLESFLARPKIYRSECLSHWEDRARANIAAEITMLDEKLRESKSKAAALN